MPMSTNLSGLSPAGRDVVRQARAVVLHRVEVVQFAVGDEDVKAPRRVLEALDEVFDGGQQLRAGAEVARRAEDVLFGLVGGQVADDFDLAAAGADGPVDAGGAAVGVDLAGEVGADLLGDRRDVVVQLLGAAEDVR